MNTADQAILDEVQAYYAAAASKVVAGEVACCDPGDDKFGIGLYDDLDGIPDAAALASIGCGNPAAVADLKPGETVLDLGSGGGIDVFLSARRVGPTGFAYGLDMTPEMLDLARTNAGQAGIENVEFLFGHMEQVPLPDASIDVIISNCVINLSPDKPAVFSESFRVLKAGGRIGVSDVVAEDRLNTADLAQQGSIVGCIAGALRESDYRQQLTHAGFTDVTITFTHEVGDGLHGAIVNAHKPAH